MEHYIDDFFTVGGPWLAECVSDVAIMKRVLAEANLPIEHIKDEGPATVISLLGLELDTVQLEVQLPEDKLMKLKADLAK